MSDLTIDPFEQVRGHLREATTRDLRRRERRRHVVGMVAIAFAALVLLTGIAAAANEQVADAIQDAGNTMLTVFDGPPASTAPSERATEMLDDMEQHRSGDPDRRSEPSKVLLHGTFDGVDVEIVATPRSKGSPTAWGPSKTKETCFSLSEDGRPGSVVCSPVFIPGLPANFATGIESGPGGVSEVTIHGVLAATVDAVYLVTPEGREEALMGDHSFYWRSDEVVPTTIEFELEDGTVKRSSLQIGSAGRPTGPTE